MAGPELQHVFGPVRSRRLGRSLGVDPVPPKTCNWNCVYCQLGRTRPLCTRRTDHLPPAEIIAELRAALQVRPRGQIDWVTFVGSGEPTLHASLGWMIREARNLTDIPVAVFTNGSLLNEAEVRADLQAADAVIASLDAGDAFLQRKINRPSPMLTFDGFIAGLTAFRLAYRGRLCIEVMLLEGLNDDDCALAQLRRRLDAIRPDEVHITLPTRPPAEPWVHAAARDRVDRAAALLGEVAQVVPPVLPDFDLRGQDSIVNAVIAVISRHPMREEDLLETLRQWAPGRVDRVLARLGASRRVQAVTRYGQRFWCGAAAHYPAGAERRQAMTRADDRRGFRHRTIPPC